MSQCLLLDLDETAQQLAVSRRTVERLVNEGSLRSVRVLQSRRIARSDLEAFVEGLRDTDRPHGTLTVLGREANIRARTQPERSRKMRIVLDALRDLATTFAAKLAADLLRNLTSSP